MIEEADRDGSGSIEFQEFLMLMDKAEKDKWTKKELKQVFTVFDKVKSSDEAIRATGLSCLFFVRMATAMSQHLSSSLS